MLFKTARMRPRWPWLPLSAWQAVKERSNATGRTEDIVVGICRSLCHALAPLKVPVELIEEQHKSPIQYRQPPVATHP
jgi:hypothetical protein